MLDPQTLTLDAWWPTFAALFLDDARPRTVEAYIGTLNVTRRVIGTPYIVDIDPYLVAKYRSDYPGSASTVAKHCRHLNAILGKLGQPGPHNRDALGLLDKVPYFKPPRTEEPVPRVPTDEEVSEFVARAATPYALFCVVAATTASRNTALRLMAANSLDPANRIIRLPETTDKRRRERVKPIPEVTARWWRDVDDRNWCTSRSGFSARWRREARRSGASRLRPHDLKRWWAKKLIEQRATPWCVKFALDHAQQDVTGRHYLAPYDELASIVDQVPLPESFTSRLAQEVGGDKQLVLFDAVGSKPEAVSRKLSGLQPRSLQP